MIRTWIPLASDQVGWPRTSGDDPDSAAPISETSPLAPHERG